MRTCTQSKTTLQNLLLLLVLLNMASCGLFRHTEKEKTTAPNNTVSSSPKKYKAVSEKLGFNVDEKCNLKLMAEASEWVGVPYKFGGNTKSGVDCSGLTNALYKNVYSKTIPRVSTDICKTSIQIEKRNLKEGDLVFFKIESKKVSHVGVYLKDNKFIHSSTKKGVIISDLEDVYYKKTFHSAGRIE